MRWNCIKLGEALSPLFAERDAWKGLLPEAYDQTYTATYRQLMCRKLGLRQGAAAGLQGSSAATATPGGGDGVVGGAGGNEGGASADAAGAGSGTPMDADAGDAGEEEDPRAGLEVNKRPLAAAAKAAGQDAVDTLIQELLQCMERSGADYTNTFRVVMGLQVPSITALAGASTGASASAGKAVHPAAGQDEAALQATLAEVLAHTATAAEIAQSHEPRIPPVQLQMLLMLAEKDPRYAAHMGDLQEELHRHKAYARMKGRSDADKAADDRTLWAEWLRKYQAVLRAEADTITASTPKAGTPAAVAAWLQERNEAMARSNPKYVLRNWIAQRAIERAEAGDFSEVQAVLRRMLDPYDLHGTSAAAAAAGGVDMSAAAGAGPSSGSCTESGGVSAPDVPPGSDPYACKPPAWASGIKVT
jgi:uncharacterized protein YdiU (UPF0061 family)